MNKLVISLVVLLAGNVWSMNSQTSVVNKQLEIAVTALDEVKSPADWQLVRGRFERLSVVDQANWLPLYYLAYADIMLSFRASSADEKMKYMDNASTCLEKIKSVKVTDPVALSEIATLRGFWYFAQMAINPAVNGPKYAGVTTASFTEAIQLNSENPRAIFLNAYFRKSMASAMNDTYEPFSKDLERADLLLAQQSAQGIMPHWGIFRMQ